MKVRNTFIAGWTVAGLVLAGGATALSLATPAHAQFGRQRGQNRQPQRGIDRTGAISWSSASNRPRLGGNAPTGFYIWHDRNTVHIISTDRSRGNDSFRGTIEIVNGKLDTVQNERNERTDRFVQTATNRIAFRFNTGQETDGFKFNLRGGDRIIFRLERNGNKTGRVFYGASKIAAGGNPVIFALNR